MKRLLFTLLPLLFGCGAKETAIPEYRHENGWWRMYVATPTNGKTVLRVRTYVGDSIAKAIFFELTECAVFLPDSWNCQLDENSSVMVDNGKLTYKVADDDEPVIFTRVRP
jgi:hypothetical protein